MAVLEKICKENDIKSIPKRDYEQLALEIREFLIEKVSEKGGHLASNLGAVELTMALHLVMDFPEDKLIFDVGHQAYTHKLLTGRKAGFDTLREYGGMSGFPKRKESAADSFNTGHSSTSISAAFGYAVERDLRHGKEKIAAIIGDGSLTGGMAYEALNMLGQARNGCVIILNDNEMSIDKNVGGVSKYLTDIRVGSTYNEIKSGVENSLLATETGKLLAKTLKRSKDSLKHLLLPGTLFEEMGITYLGPIDGHDIHEMVSTFQKAFALNKPILIHVKTKKGYGYRPAELHPAFFHGVAPFDAKTGKLRDQKTTSTYTDIFAKHMLTIGAANEKVVAITAAMADGTGLTKFKKEFPKRFFDVGIAEQHAVTFAAGMAAAGLVPVFAVYSSFLQRGYDQVLHDVCLQKLHVIFAIDRAGLVGQDGETHQGIYDISYLSHMPGLEVLAPKNRYELEAMMDYAINSAAGPVAIRYARGNAYKGLKEYQAPIVSGKSEILTLGETVCILACGNMVEEAVLLCERLKEEGITPTLVNVRFVSTIDEEMVAKVLETSKYLVTMEENVTSGGYGERLMAYLKENYATKDLVHIDGSIQEGFVEQGKVSVLRNKLGIDAESLFNRLMEKIKETET